ncbi:MAG: hypothetical protein AB7U05_11525 [Mangrovibacterium sp.]
MILLVSAVFPPEPVVSATIAHDLAVTLSDDATVRVLRPKPTRPYGFSFDCLRMEYKKFEHVILPSYTCARSGLLDMQQKYARLVKSYAAIP